MRSLQPRREPSLAPDHASTLFLNFQCLELWEINFCSLKAIWLVVFCYSSTNRLRHLPCPPHFLVAILHWSCYHQFIKCWHVTFSLSLKTTCPAMLLCCFYKQLNIPSILLASAVLSLFITTKLLYSTHSSQPLPHSHVKPADKLNQFTFKVVHSIILLWTHLWLLPFYSFLCDSLSTSLR